MKRTPRIFLIPLALMAMVAAGCGSDDNNNGAGAETTASAVATTAAAPSTSAAATSSASTTAAPTSAAATTTSAPAVSGNLTVFAAASLTDAFKEIGTAFTAANPDAKVTFSFDASSALAQQINQGAPADVFASADGANMDKVTKPGLNGTAPVTFATNLLTIIVEPGNPKGITGVADLAKPDLKVVLCAAEVPCGRYAGQILSTAGVTLTPVSLEQNVKGVVTKVTAGEADAGIVYVTDVTATKGRADMVAIPEDINVVAQYPIATVKASKNQDADQAFIDFVLGTDGQAILKKYGFGAP
jgi:molybdate transport system substrate-binding protein